MGMLLGEEILRQPVNVAPQGARRVRGPVRVAQQAAPEGHQVAATVLDELVGLVRVVDETNRNRRRAALCAHLLPKPTW